LTDYFVVTAKLFTNSCIAASSEFRLGQRAGLSNRVEQVRVLRPEVDQQLGLESTNVLNGNRVEPALGAGVDRDALLFDRHRRIEALLEQLGEAIAPVELTLGRLVQLRTEGREGLEVAELGEVDLERPATERMALIWAAPPTRDTELPTSIAGRTPE